MRSSTSSSCASTLRRGIRGLANPGNPAQRSLCFEPTHSRAVVAGTTPGFSQKSRLYAKQRPATELNLDRRSAFLKRGGPCSPRGRHSLSPGPVTPRCGPGHADLEVHVGNKRFVLAIAVLIASDATASAQGLMAPGPALPSNTGGIGPGLTPIAPGPATGPLIEQEGPAGVPLAIGPQDPTRPSLRRSSHARRTHHASRTYAARHFQ